MRSRLVVVVVSAIAMLLLLPSLASANKSWPVYNTSSHRVGSVRDLRMRFRVVDADDQELAVGRDWERFNSNCAAWPRLVSRRCPPRNSSGWGA